MLKLKRRPTPVTPDGLRRGYHKHIARNGAIMGARLLVTAAGGECWPIDEQVM